MKHIIVTMIQSGQRKQFDVIAHSTIEAMLSIIGSVHPGKPFMVSGKVAS